MGYTRKTSRCLWENIEKFLGKHREVFEKTFSSLAGCELITWRLSVGIAEWLNSYDESLYWLEILLESSTVKHELVAPLMKEADELVSIFVATLKTAKGK